jgi:microcystin degradation protein MlrC
VLQALIDAGIDNAAVGTIYDPGTVQQAMKAGVGAEIDVALGGHTDESMGSRSRPGRREDAVGRRVHERRADECRRRDHMGRRRCCASAASTSSPSPTASRPSTCRSS